MNLIIAVVVGGVLGVVGTISGVAAYQGSPDGVSQLNLYNYADD